MLSTTLRHPSGCPLTVGHPLSLGVSGSLTLGIEHGVELLVLRVWPKR